MRVAYMHFERLLTTRTALQKEYGVDSLEAFLDMYGSQGWELVYFGRRGSSEAELIFKQGQ